VTYSYSKGWDPPMDIGYEERDAIAGVLRASVADLASARDRLREAFACRGCYGRGDVNTADSAWAAMERDGQSYDDTGDGMTISSEEPKWHLAYDESISLCERWHRGDKDTCERCNNFLDAQREELRREVQRVEEARPNENHPQLALDAAMRAGFARYAMGAPCACDRIDAHACLGAPLLKRPCACRCHRARRLAIAYDTRGHDERARTSDPRCGAYLRA
jgi:hypothetical protein